MSLTIQPGMAAPDTGAAQPGQPNGQAFAQAAQQVQGDPKATQNAALIKEAIEMGTVSVGMSMMSMSQMMLNNIKGDGEE